MLKIYTVWKKTYWKKGTRKNHRTWTVLDNTSKKIHVFNSKQFHEHFQLWDKNKEPLLWKKIREKNPALPELARKKGR
jgi:hypothetical protein